MKRTGTLGKHFVVRYNHPIDIAGDNPAITIQNFEDLRPGWLVIYRSGQSSLPSSLPIPTPTIQYSVFEKTPGRERPLTSTLQDGRSLAEGLWRVYKENRQTLDVFREAFQDESARGES